MINFDIAPDRVRADDGFTLTELMVSMAIFLTVLAIVFSVITDMTSGLRKTQGMADSSAETQRAFLRLEKQVRYADAVNQPVKVGTNWYLEFRTSAGDPDTCTQWRLNGAEDSLQYRTWPSATPPPLLSWTTVARGIVNDPGVIADRPFTLRPADLSIKKQTLQVFLKASSGGNDRGTTESTSRFVARNTSYQTGTNAVDASTGRSETEYCLQAGRP